MIRTLVSAAMLASIAACATQPSGNAGNSTAPAVTAATDDLHGVLWMQTSAEYQMATRQTFRAALASIDRGLADRGWTAALEQSAGYESLPPAIVVDVDETILDNSPFQARLIRDDSVFNEPAWERWVSEAAARPLPGAADFLRAVRARGVEVFYVTNRELQAPTLTNLQREIDSRITADKLMCRGERAGWGSDKTSRRELVASEYRVLALLGDDYNDFAFLGKANPIQRRQKAAIHRDRWGVSWFILPNPVYGNFERSAYGFDYALSSEDRRARKRESLETAD